MLGADKTPGEIVAEILMTRQVHSGSFLLVEGDGDSRFFRPRIHDTACQIVIGGGKQTVLAALQRLQPSAQQGVLGAFERAGQNVRAALLERGLVFGHLRWLALRHGWALATQHLSVPRFIDARTWSLDETQLLAEAGRHGCPLTPPDLQAARAALPSADPWLVCQGHDLIDILALGLKSVLGGAATLGRRQISALLRQSLDRADFMTTTLAKDIRGWQQHNPPYLILRD